MSSELLWLVGRALLGGLFVVGGIRHFFIVPIVTEMIAARGVPMPRLILIAGSVFQVITGLMLMLGFFIPVAIICLIVFTLCASVLLLNFWDMQGEAKAAAKIAWQSNLAIIGGLLIAFAHALTLQSSL